MQIASDRDKLHWEIKKLQAETEAMRRPAYLSPSGLVPIITGLVAANESSTCEA